MGRRGNDKAPRFVDDVIAIAEARIAEALSIAPATAREVATEIANSLCDMYARTEIYIPLNLEPRLTARDELIWQALGQDSPSARRWSQDRLRELAAEHKLSPRHVRAIVSRMHRRERELRQPQLEL